MTHALSLAAGGLGSSRRFDSCVSVSTIAASVGYFSPAQFSRDYKRAFGSTPSQDTTEVRIAEGVYLPSPHAAPAGVVQLVDDRPTDREVWRDTSDATPDPVGMTLYGNRTRK
ncbi:AraC family transcriptional regulator [Nocardia jiangxiensis]|uniref:AraC family transcriptional regulator n=1 Tax=Nocardia jiangxiensis TaxID=282685 RepID=A0ABW6SJ74_9NOCA